VIDLAAVREQAVGAAADTHVEIIELCALAGRADLAGEFVRSKLSVAQVRGKLTDLRAQVSATRSTSAHIMPDAGNNPNQAAAAGWDKAFARVRGVKTKE
jgi:hypothetical protein